ncbi:unnamed protein product [Lactuca saligna]|uniref:Uncharacterized protein n=1 Tax=Lactuca saligna TaxID=75948 RepID=A0AA35VIC9_LACSI|nr:unnamed protein product [Lactuca saligna]
MEIGAQTVPNFSLTSIKENFPSCGGEVISTYKIGKSLIVKSYLGSVAFNNITRITFGKQFVNSEGMIDEQGKEFKSIMDNGIKLGGSLAIPEHIPWLWWFFPLEEEAFTKHGERRDRLTRAIMEEHIAARMKSGGTKQHFVDILLMHQKQYDLSDDSIIGLLWDMITAGMDTATSSVEWAMAEIIKNPRVQQKVQQELDSIIGYERVLTEPDFSNLPYLRNVAKEALRLHPQPHSCSLTKQIQMSKLAVTTSQKGPTPERFLEEDVDMKGHDYRLLPFGAGRRACPGAQLGLNLMTSMLGHLLHHFSWALANGLNPGEIDMSENPGLVTYMRTPLEAIATPRLPVCIV